ncbi:carbohydrate ABC transporter permease [Actinophytocola gossypii]|uniref:Sugar ABC transporter permease n=1 Tax=Actinophytocola gossypii TaxID=2812003 RepID=A0ABT2J556_9PSEU|nr:sugar ABC transporter permease [Actinophytocola gossypii]MCT2582998.1 sugar ABC transporter permease [Actinophytocola gossypii]
MTTTAHVTVPAGPPPPAPPRAGRPRRADLGERTIPYLLLAPAVITMLVLLGWPAVQVVAISFRRLDLGELVRGEIVWIGLDNYRAALSDPEVWTVVLRTVVFTACVVAATVLVAGLLAILLRHLAPGVRVAVQTFLVLAWATPIVAATTVFQWIFDQQYGILNKTLVKLGFDGFAGYSWFSSGPSTLTVIGLMIVWQAVPFVCFTIYAGLLTAPRELYEAAAMDGASPWQAFTTVSWPSIRPLVMLATFLSVIWDFKVFAQVWAFRQGGPDGESTTLPVLLYLKGIASRHFGLASAIAVLMILVLLVLTARYLQLLLRSKEGDL